MSTFQTRHKFGIFPFWQNEEERDENDEKDISSTINVTNSKFDLNEKIEDGIKTTDQNNRPNDLPSLSSNHIITSPVNSNSNAVWNSDSWADGDFEPIEETSLGKFDKKLCFLIFFLLTQYTFHSGNSKLDEARRKREEKKVQRQRELEARRVARGPLKLGAKKL